MTVQQLLERIQDLSKKENIFRLDLEELLVATLSCERSELLVKRNKKLSAQQIKAFESHLKRYLEGEPVAYILGYKDFYKYRFHVDANVLIPRPDTETLLECALQIKNVNNLADLGVGSGCLGLSFLKERPEAFLHAWDIDQAALQIAQKNAMNLGVSNQVQWCLESPEQSDLEQTFDLVISNPPYISIDDPRVEKSVKNFEPSRALFAKNEGLEYYTLWTPWAYQTLNKDGWLMYECGQGQAPLVQKICQQNNFTNIAIEKDLSGIERVVLAQKKD